MKNESLVKFYQTYKLYIFPAIVAISSLILIIFIIYPQTINLINNQTQGTELLSKSKFLETKVQALEGYDFEQLNKKVEVALSVFPPDKDFIVAIDLIQNLIAQSNFNMISMTLGTGSSKNSNVQSYSITLNISGPNKLLPTLLSKIEGMPRLMRVDNVGIISSRDIQNIQVSLNINALYLTAPTDFGTVDAPLPQLSQKDEEVIAKLAINDGKASLPQSVTQMVIPATELGPRGKENPFE